MDCGMLLACPELYDGCWSLCSEERRAKAGRLLRPGDRAASMGVYTLFAVGLRQMTGTADLPALRVARGGKPYAELEGICFNFSHSGSYAACGFSPSPLGVDVECGVRNMSRPGGQALGMQRSLRQIHRQGLAEKLAPSAFDHIDRDGTFAWEGQYLYSKALDGCVLSVFSAGRRVILEKVGEADLRRFLKERERSISESTGI